MTPTALAALIEQGRSPIILDVRSRAEFDDGHVPGAIHVPFWQVRGRLPVIPAAPQDPIVVYCGHGPRAWIAGAALRRRGFARVIYLVGHMAAWRRTGLREERTSRPDSDHRVS